MTDEDLMGMETRAAMVKLGPWASPHTDDPTQIALLIAARHDVLALVAEVRRLRALIAAPK